MKKKTQKKRRIKQKTTEKERNTEKGESERPQPEFLTKEERERKNVKKAQEKRPTTPHHHQKFSAARHEREKKETSFHHHHHHHHHQTEEYRERERESVEARSSPSSSSSSSVKRSETRPLCAGFCLSRRYRFERVRFYYIYSIVYSRSSERKSLDMITMMKERNPMRMMQQKEEGEVEEEDQEDEKKTKTKKNEQREEIYEEKKLLVCYTREDVSKSSFFLIIVDGLVLNVEHFSHPGGNKALEQYKGKDATNAFRKEVAHGQNAEKMLNKLIVGKIVGDYDDDALLLKTPLSPLSPKTRMENTRRNFRRKGRRMKGGEDVVSNNENTNWSSSSDSYNHHHQYERRNRSVSASSEEGTSSSSSMLNLGEGGENVRGSSSEDLCLERLSDGDGSEIGVVGGGLNACASFEDVNTAVYNSAGAARPSVVVVVSDDDDDDKEDKKNGVDEYGINFNKPLLQQVPFLKEKYFEWTHIPEPSRADGTQQRFFEADWMEALSVTAWYVVLLIWLPVVVWNVIKGAEQSSERAFSCVSQLAAFGFGLFAWGFKEYAMHRFLFHKEPPANSPFFITFHFLFHGCHHKHPMDALRLVFPPVLAGPIAFGFYSFYSLLCGSALAKLVIAGSLTGYVAYDMTHYACHHLASAASESAATTNINNKENIFTRYARRVKRRHMTHHYESPDLIFGISQSTWDVVFGTSSSSSSSAAEAVANNDMMNRLNKKDR